MDRNLAPTTSKGWTLDPVNEAARKNWWPTLYKTPAAAKRARSYFRSRYGAEFVACACVVSDTGGGLFTWTLLERLP